MMDFATSTDPRVQAQLDRLPKASSAGDILTLDRIRELCTRLGNPQQRLPPVFHVAGTNGKGSTIAWLRAAIEAGGGTVHAFTSPHLVRFNERIRVSGSLIEDRDLAPLLEQVIDAGDGLDASFFEVATAAAFIAFARAPADATLVEVGLGGRLDATNIVSPIVTGIAALGIDHAHILGDTLGQIALEKAGIAKAGVPLVVLDYPPDIDALIAGHAARTGAPLVRVSRSDGPATLDPAQVANRALAEAMLANQTAVTRFDLAGAAASFAWPARMQRLTGPLVAGLRVPVTLDGAHNAQGAEQLAAAVDGLIVLMAGLLANRDPADILAPFAGKVARFIALPISDHDAHQPASLAAVADALFGRDDSLAAASIEQGFEQLRALDPRLPVVVIGSLYLAGDILRLSGIVPD
ncbi:MAG: bifunctional folylpolyglutamate synthase/dihydrofolate synthase [Sphingomicrobium sp.]